MRYIYLPVCFLLLGSALAQQQPQKESPLHADFRLEHGRFDANCLGKSSDAKAPKPNESFFGCIEVLFTDHPLHIAIGSIAPQNGFAAGLAVVTHHDFTKRFLKSQWLYKGDMDAVGSANGSWRAGAYAKFIPVPVKERKKPEVHDTNQPSSEPQPPKKSKLRIVSVPLINVYAQAISLNKLGFFGLGPLTSVAGRSFFGMSETIVGSNAIFPLPWSRKLNLSLVGEVNGRFIDVRGAHGEPSPSIETLYSPAAAPGLATQPGFLQFGEGLRIKPTIFSKLHLDYFGNFQQFVAPSNSAFSFRRFTVDLSHQLQLSKNEMNQPKPHNNPDECSEGSQAIECPTMGTSTTNRYGAITLRFLLSESFASGGSIVPFYFQPTLGGGDINGSASLGSYQDYRFRGPDLMLFHGDFEHSIPWLDKLKRPVPVGFYFAADAGKVALTRGDIDFQHFRHTFATGLTVRAGGFPMVYLLYAWGGREGTHILGNVNTSLLGGSSRPSLF